MKIFDGEKHPELFFARHHLYVPLSPTEGMLTLTGIVMTNLTSATPDWFSETIEIRAVVPPLVIPKISAGGGVPTLKYDGGWVVFVTGSSRIVVVLTLAGPLMNSVSPFRRTICQDLCQFASNMPLKAAPELIVSRIQ
jgi:hypothetical protein